MTRNQGMMWRKVNHPIFKSKDKLTEKNGSKEIQIKQCNQDINEYLKQEVK